MKRGRKVKTEIKSEETSLIKSTILLDKDLKQHLVIASLTTGEDQSEIVRAGLRKILREMGVEVDKPPTLPTLTCAAAHAV